MPPQTACDTMEAAATAKSRWTQSVHIFRHDFPLERTLSRGRSSLVGVLSAMPALGKPVSDVASRLLLVSKKMVTGPGDVKYSGTFDRKDVDVGYSISF